MLYKKDWREKSFALSLIAKEHFDVIVISIHLSLPSLRISGKKNSWTVKWSKTDFMQCYCNGRKETSV